MLDEEEHNGTPNEPNQIPEEPSFPEDRREKSEGEPPKIG